MTDEQQACKSCRGRYLGIGVAVGAGIGTALGAATGNIGVWLPIGLAVGIGIGAALSRRNAGETSVPGPKQ